MPPGKAAALYKPSPGPSFDTKYQREWQGHNIAVVPPKKIVFDMDKIELLSHQSRHLVNDWQ